MKAGNVIQVDSASCAAMGVAIAEESLAQGEGTHAKPRFAWGEGSVSLSRVARGRRMKAGNIFQVDSASCAAMGVAIAEESLAQGEGTHAKPRFAWGEGSVSLSRVARGRRMKAGNVIQVDSASCAAMGVAIAEESLAQGEGTHAKPRFAWGEGSVSLFLKGLK